MSETLGAQLHMQSNIPVNFITQAQTLLKVHITQVENGNFLLSQWQ